MREILIILSASFQTEYRTLGLKACDTGTLIQILCFWILSIVMFLSDSSLVQDPTYLEFLIF
jgi:hypothetical protein